MKIKKVWERPNLLSLGNKNTEGGTTVGAIEGRHGYYSSTDYSVSS